MFDDDIKIICLVPCRNEAWILNTFLSCASMWADHIIISDQFSTDISREIMSRFPKVTILDNPPDYTVDEYRLRMIFFDYCRVTFHGKIIYIALDCDEILVGNELLDKIERLKSLPPGTTITFNHMNIHPNKIDAWFAGSVCWGFVEDWVTPFKSKEFHGTRLPLNNSHVVDSGCFVWHLQFIDWERMQSKHRWYECVEIIKQTETDPIKIYRKYHHMYSEKVLRLTPVDTSLAKIYSAQGIDVFAFVKDPIYRWDSEILKMFKTYGEEHFKYLDIWDVNWSGISKSHVEEQINIRDPRGLLIRLVNMYLKTSQKFYPNLATRAIDKAIKLLGYGKSFTKGSTNKK